MVTDAEWTDLNSDGVLELITVSDWGNINIFVNNNGFYKKLVQILVCLMDHGKQLRSQI